MSKNKLLGLVTKFLIGGIPGSAIHFVILYLLTGLFEVDAVIASMIGVLPSFLVNFTVYKFWVFEDDNIKVIKTQLLVAFSITIIYTALDGIIMLVLISSAGMSKLWAQIIVKIVLGPLSFLANRSVFPKKPGN